jgi:hypothetical protein
VGWWEFVLDAVVGGLVVFGPGVLVAAALRLTGLWLAAGACAIGVSLTAATTLLCGWLDVPLSAGPLALVTVLTAASCWIVTRWVVTGARRRPSSPTVWPTAAGVAIGTALLTVRFATSIGDPGRFAQAGDNVFHLNAVRWILDGGASSPLGFGGFGDAENALAFYPTAWHSLTALIAQASGASIPVASNATLFLFSCIAWPVAAILVTRTLFGRAPVLLMAAGILSAGFAAYPFQLIAYMGTFPLVGVVPLTAIALSALWRACDVDRFGPDHAIALVLIALSMPGIALMHPSGLILLAVLALPPLWVVVSRVAHRHPGRRTFAYLLFVLATAAVLVIVLSARTVLSQDGAWRGTIAQSIGEYALFSLGGRPISVVALVLMWIGLVYAIRRKRSGGRVIAATWVLIGVIYVASAGDDELFRLVVSGPWYADSVRVAAFAPIAALPLAARGAQVAWAWAAARSRRRGLSPSYATRAGFGVAAAVALAAVVVLEPGVRAVDAGTRAVYEPTDNPVVSRVAVGPDERAVLEEVRRIVPAGDVIAGSAHDGSSFAYALTGRPVVIEHVLAPLTPRETEFFDGFATALPSDRACRAARELGVAWILEFHPDKLAPTAPRYPGLQGLDDSANVELAYRSGDSSLYQVTGCGIG